ncbi:MAG: DnaJ domain-containing protein [Candidatus Contendobacter sp.]|nr:DnaJ domain-containing protein [Candidatus Contendobacter sp.]MDG4559552.1 DnaJ domain-containing protein [Candidatus Contendobacter sp.]
MAIAIGVTILLLLLTVRGGAEIAVSLLAVLIPLLVRWAAARPSPSPGTGTLDDQSADSSKVAGAMDRAEAYQVLGLQPEASREEIQAAYRRLIQRVHPDHGGSSYLAARLNRARDVLLGLG